MINRNEEIVLDESIDQLLQQLPVGSIDTAIANNLYGVNFRQTGNVVPRSKDMYGFTFFTRPQLNLNIENISNFRAFYNLLTSNEKSYQRYTRMMLDPRLGLVNQMKCPFVNNQNPFIPVLTNNIVSLSGWPDLSVPSFTSEPGIYGEEHSFVDGVTNHYESFDLDISFKNTKGNPLIYLFYIWIKYETLVFEGILNPYIDMVTENEIDYNTRIYRIVLDQRKRYVRYIAATGASFPINVPTGNLFDYNVDTPYNTKNSEINIRFRSLGFMAFEDILKLQFNQTTAIFNPDIRKLIKADMDASETIAAREDGMMVYKAPGTSLVRVPHYLAMSIDTDISGGGFYSVNHKAIPYINLITNELEWWVDERIFRRDSQNNFRNTIENSGLPNIPDNEVQE